MVPSIAMGAVADHLAPSFPTAGRRWEAERLGSGIGRGHNVQLAHQGGQRHTATGSELR
jgi:hypothetical protein